MEEVDFLDLLEKEEADFAEQIRKQKSFLQVGRRWAVLGIQNLQYQCEKESKNVDFLENNFKREAFSFRIIQSQW